MHLVERTFHAVPGIQSPRVTPAELEYMAFHGQHELVHELYKGLPAESRARYANKYILSEVVAGGILALRKLAAASLEESVRMERDLIDQTATLFISTSKERGSFPRELFLSILQWADELFRMSLLNQSQRYYDDAVDLGVSRFPELYVRALKGKAELLSRRGQIPAASEILTSLAERPYLVSDRNVVPDIMLALSKIALQTGNVTGYKNLLFGGLRLFYSSIQDRRQFVDQLRATYKRSLYLLIHPEVSVSSKVLYALHWMHYRIADRKLLRDLGIARFSAFAVLGYVYALNYFYRRQHGGQASVMPVPSRNGFGVGRSEAQERAMKSGRKDILITRAMGGIGDLLMMTPGFHALSQKCKNQKIHLAIPRRFFPVFEGNNDVVLLDIDTGKINHLEYRRWYNLTDCPAARGESLAAPRVRRSRVDLFAAALGIGPIRRLLMDHTPRYVVADEEISFQRQFWTKHHLTGKRVVAVQLRADETYRNYPHMEYLVRALAAKHHVLLFDSEVIRGFEYENVLKVQQLPLRLAFALVAACDAIIAPDSAFVHLAAALLKPCVALYGPVDGKVRTKHYPHCRYIDVRADLKCVPCWRNEVIPCRLTGMRSSVCMGSISVGLVTETLDTLLMNGRQQ